MKLLNKKIIKFIMPFSFLLLLQETAFSQTVQWASEVLGFSSQYSSKISSARQALGKPSVMPDFGITKCAWTFDFHQKKGTEWIKLGYKIPMHIKQIAIAQNDPQGLPLQVFLYDTTDREYLIYSAINTPSKLSAFNMKNIYIPHGGE